MSIADLYADGWSRIVATLIRHTGGDWDLAEECAQEAFAQALQKWPHSGVPGEPLAWLITTARNRAIDVIRRSATEARKLREVGMMRSDPLPVNDSDIPDDRLELMFTCCHPSLSVEAQVVLTLRSLAGMSTAEIGRAFLVPERTMGQRLFRAKQKVKNAGIPFRVPPAHLLPERLPAVLHVLYLLFNTGYGEVSQPPKVAEEAIRLARVLASLMPDEPEAHGLLALMLLQEARRPARSSAEGDLIPLEEQDRGLWNQGQITEGEALLERALRRGRPGQFQVQAAIAACHATAATAAQTDWEQIAGLYDDLLRLVPTPVVALNRAVAIGMARGPDAALPLLDELATGGALDGYYLLPATRADLLRRAGHDAQAKQHYQAALDLAPTEPERRYLRRRLGA